MSLFAMYHDITSSRKRLRDSIGAGKVAGREPAAHLSRDVHRQFAKVLYQPGPDGVALWTSEGLLKVGHTEISDRLRFTGGQFQKSSIDG